MASLINRIQRAMLGSAGPEKVHTLLAELAIPAGLSEAEYPTSGDDVLVVVFPVLHGNALQSITLYDPLPSTAGLSELSEVA